MIGRKLACAMLLCTGLLVTSVGVAQDYVLTLQDASGNVGTDVTAAVLFDNTGVDSVQGWSYGVCHDDTMATLTAAVGGSTTLTVNGGDEPDFLAINDAPVSLVGDHGYTCGVVIDFFGIEALAPGTGYELTVGTYNLLAEGTSPVALCGTLGDPAVETLIVVAGGSNVPLQNAGTLEGTIVLIEIFFDAGDALVRYDNLGATVSQGTVNISMTNDDPLAAVQGYSFGLTHDGALLELVDINLDGTVTALTNGGAGPDFFAPTLAAVGGTGGTLGVVVSLSPPFDVIPQGIDQSIANFVYDAGPSPIDTTTDVCFTDTLGNPAVALVAVVDGNTVDPMTTCGTVTLEEAIGNSYLRADANADGIVNIADGIWIINRLWQGGPDSVCAAAEDANGDSLFDTSDALYIFYWRLLDGPAPVGAFPGCDTANAVDCAVDTCPL